MKNLALIVGGMVAVLAQTLSAAMYSYEGPQYGEPGSPVLNGGRLDLTSGNGGAISGTFHMGETLFSSGASLVFYIDSVPGGLATTSAFNQTQANPEINAISGYRRNSSPSLVSFPSGFAPDYAIVMRPASQRAVVYQITDTEIFQVGRELNSTPYTPDQKDLSFTVYWSHFGLDDKATGNSFKFVSTYINESGSRFAESLENFTMPGGTGYNPITFTSFDVFPEVPEPVTVALGWFGVAAGAVGLGRRWWGANGRGRRGDGRAVDKGGDSGRFGG